jgi:hypothetical protein
MEQRGLSVIICDTTELEIITLNVFKIRLRFATTYHYEAKTWHNELQRGNKVVQRRTTWLHRSKNMTEREQNAFTTLCCGFCIHINIQGSRTRDITLYFSLMVSVTLQRPHREA